MYLSATCTFLPTFLRYLFKYTSNPPPQLDPHNLISITNLSFKVPEVLCGKSTPVDYDSLHIFSLLEFDTRTGQTSLIKQFGDGEYVTGS